MLRFTLFSLIILEIFAAGPSPTAGPYKSRIVSVQECQKLSRPYIASSPFFYEATLRNSSKGPLIAGNFTVVREIRNVKVKLKSFIWRNGKWELNYCVKSLDCHGMIIHLLYTATQVRYDRKTCTYFKGTYTYAVDSDSLQHIWREKLEYGRSKWRAEAWIAAGTLFCREFEIVVEPA